MSETSRITSKRQITIPAKIFNELGLEQGDQLVFEIKEEKIVLQKSQDILNELAGSVKVPSSYKKLSPEEIVKKAKTEYFKDRE
jgi:AbrB family looped-hinge helix DNA binding protein